MIQTRILFFVLAGAVLIGAVSLFSQSNTASSVLHLPNKEISLIVVSTSETRTKGLSGMESLPENTAMLFSFNEPDRYGIWMKDMKFSIDILWLDEKGKIIHIENDISPDTYPKVFTPLEISSYVLEANVGFAKENDLKVGKTLNFSK